MPFFISGRSAANPGASGLRRLLLGCFNFCAFLRMLIVDRRPLLSWWVEMRERLGFVPFQLRQSIWIHGEGMGEFNGAAALIRELRARHPACGLVFTSSRCATRDWLIGRYPADACLSQPWDTPFAVARFFRRLRPRLLVLLEFHDGFCPGALLKAREEMIPIVVVNARRLPEHKPLRYRIADRLGLVNALAACIDHFCVQDDETADWLQNLPVAAAAITMTGNLKYDCTPASSGDIASFRELTGLDRSHPIVTISCIHAQEARLVVAAIHRLCSAHPDVRFVLAPLGPLQAGRLGRRLRAARMAYVRRSRRQALSSEPVLLLDSFNELSSAYGASDGVVVAGSLVAGGAGHSLVEAAVQGRPIVVGPFIDAQRKMVECFRAAGAVLQCDAKELTATLENLLADAELRGRIGGAAQRVVAQQAGATARTLDAIAPLLSIGSSELQPRLSLVKRALATVARSPLGQRTLALRFRRIQTLDELRTRLGQTDTILCLGNGPSSEDHELDAIRYDRLFRVNWRWHERARFDRPDIVFTGDRRSLRRCPPCLFGFRSIAEEVSILGRAFFSSPRSVTYFTAERLPMCVNDTWPARPTNGAVMIALAAALQPKRLVIAGIDLFQHPRGAYPTGVELNRYADVHDREVELAIIRRALADYRGELRVIGDPLREALRGKRAA